MYSIKDLETGAEAIVEDFDKAKKVFKLFDKRAKAMRESMGVGCLWDNLTDEQRKQPMGLSCPCPKCTFR